MGAGVARERWEAARRHINRLEHHHRLVQARHQPAAQGAQAHALVRGEAQVTRGCLAEEDLAAMANVRQVLGAQHVQPPQVQPAADHVVLQAHARAVNGHAHAHASGQGARPCRRRQPRLGEHRADAVALAAHRVAVALLERVEQQPVVMVEHALKGEPVLLPQGGRRHDVGGDQHHQLGGRVGLLGHLSSLDAGRAGSFGSSWRTAARRRALGWS